MTCLYIDKRGIELDYVKEALIVYQDKKRKATIPMQLLERIVLASQVKLSASVLGKLGALGIGVTILTGLKREVSLLMPAKHDAKKRKQQYFHCSKNALALAKWLMHQKFESQYRLLSSYDLADDDFWQQQQDKRDKAQSLAQLLGIEGTSARHYFNALQQIIPEKWQFKGRNRHPAKDPVNVLLSLSYTLLYSEATRLITVAGLDSEMGFYHQLHSQRFALSCDVIEPARALIDEWILTNLLNEEWQLDDFSFRADQCILKKEARTHFYQLFSKLQSKLTHQLKETIKNLSQKWEIEGRQKPEQWQEWEDLCTKER